MKHLSILATLVLSAILSLSAQSNRPSISLSLDRDSVSIGDQVTLSVEVDKDVMQVVMFPEIDTERAGGIIEIIESSEVDTLSNEGRRMQIAKRYNITSFNAGSFRVSDYPVLYLDKNIVDTLYSPDTLLLRVSSFEIDTATMNIHDIRPIKDIPVMFGEWSGWAALGLVGLLLCGLIVWVIVRLVKHKPVFSKVKPAIPPHIKAINELNELQHQKLWQNGKHKLYYTRLTEILREYLDGRYGVSAMEMTTDEILEAIKELAIDARQFTTLAELLQTADFVKFAKHTPDDELNESLFSGVYYFVENTKQVNPEEDNNEYKEAMKI